MKRLLLILISFAWIPFIAEEVRGCTCIEYDVPVCAAYYAIRVRQGIYALASSQNG